MNRVAVIGVPSSAGARRIGQERAPQSRCGPEDSKGPRYFPVFYDHSVFLHGSLILRI